MLVIRQELKDEVHKAAVWLQGEIAEGKQKSLCLLSKQHQFLHNFPPLKEATAESDQLVGGSRERGGHESLQPEKRLDQPICMGP